MPHGVCRLFIISTLQQFQQLQAELSILLVDLARVLTKSQFVKALCSALAARKIDTELCEGAVFLRRSREARLFYLPFFFAPVGRYGTW
jgi:hypothetical protein